MKKIIIVSAVLLLLGFSCDDNLSVENRCEKISCFEWEVCVEESASCSLKEGFCNENSHCLEEEKPMELLLLMGQLIMVMLQLIMMLLLK